MALRGTSDGVDLEAVVRAVFQASDQAIGLGRTAEDHIQHTIVQLRNDREVAANLLAAFPETASPTFPS